MKKLIDLINKDRSLWLNYIIPAPLYILVFFAFLNIGNVAKEKNKQELNTSISIPEDSINNNRISLFEEEKNETVLSLNDLAADANLKDSIKNVEMKKIMEQNNKIYKEQDRMMSSGFQEYKPRTNSNYNANEILENRMQNTSKPAQEEEKFNTVRSTESTTDIESVVVCIDQGTYLDGQSVKFKVVKPIGTTTMGQLVYGNVSIGTNNSGQIVFSGRQFGIKSNLYIKNIEIDQTSNQDQQNTEIKNDIKSEGSTIVGGLVSSIPIVGNGLSRTANTISRNRNNNQKKLYITLYKGERFKIEN